MAIIMKTLLSIFLITCAMTIVGFSQEIEGSWQGVLDVQTVKLRLVFNIEKTADGFKSTMDSPDQGAKGIPVTSTSFANSELILEIQNAGIKYTGKLNSEGVIVGTFNQGGSSYLLDLTHGKPAALVRPQEPKPPFPYRSEDVTFENSGAKIKLAGTLTSPKEEGVYPVVVLISGSGPQNRNEELFGHKPFLVIADYLTRNGIAVLRYDDRGVGESQGNFGKATSEDFAADVRSAVKYLKTRKDINKAQIGLIGHSEGGVIAPMVAADDKDIAFIVLLAGSGIPGDELILAQKKLIEKASGIDDATIEKGQELFKGAYDIIKKTKSTDDVKAPLTKYFTDNQIPEKETASIVSQLSSDWFRYFITFDPARVLAKVKVPVLALNGENDLQVPAKINLDAIKDVLTKAGNKNVTVKAFPKLNHLFQESKTGLVTEYGQIEQTFSPDVLDEISDWIIAQTKN